MQLSDFQQDCPGRLVPTDEGVLAFHPGPVPRRLELPSRLEILASEAERAIGRLGGLLFGGGSPLNPHLVGGPLQAREAIESSRIEGTFTTPEELAFSDPDDGLDLVTSDTREVRNYLVALDWGVSALQKLPIGPRFIKELHERLMRDTRGGQERPGEFRKIQNYIGAGLDPAAARFVPPPASAVSDLMDDLAEFIHLPRQHWTASRLIRLALVHYQFETIHPFHDGNGRVGRLLIPLLIRAEEAEDPPLYLSAYFERRRQNYYDLLLAVSQAGRFADWIEFFLEGVRACADESIELARKILGIRQRYADLVHQHRWSSTLLKVVDSLFELPALTVKRVERITGVSTPTAVSHIKRLAEAGIIRETTGRKRNQRYVASEIILAVHGPP